MVRINLIKPANLADQHLIAEYDEILMLLGYVRQYPSIEDLPPNYTLGTGHVRFFKDKLLYLKKRHELIKSEMRKRGFVPAVTIRLSDFSKASLNDWKPSKPDFAIIRQRLTEKFRKKPDYYRYYGSKKPLSFFLSMTKKAE
jgi:deoxyribonuclease (pyrimidine dimer)